MQKQLYKHFDLPGHTKFLEGVTVTLIDKTDFREPTERGKRRLLNICP